MQPASGKEKESILKAAAERAQGSEPGTRGSDSGGDGSSGGAEVEPEKAGPKPALHVPNPERAPPKRPGGACPAGWAKVLAVPASTGSPVGDAKPQAILKRKALPPLILPPAGVYCNEYAHALAS